MFILSNVIVGLSTCGSTWTPIYSCFFFFLNITGCNHFTFLDKEFNYPYIFFHHSYFVSSCCSELYHKFKKFQPLSPISALGFGCWDPIQPTSEGFPTSVCRHICATAASTLQLLLTSRDAKPVVVVLWASPGTLESPDWPLYVVTTVQVIFDIGSMSFSSLYDLSDS